MNDEWPYCPSKYVTYVERETMMMMMIHRELRLHRPNWFSPFLDTHGMNSIEATSIEDMTRDTAALQASHNSSPNSFSVQRKQDVVVESFAHLPRWWPHSRETWSRPNRQRPPFLRRLFASQPSSHIKKLASRWYFLSIVVVCGIIIKSIACRWRLFQAEQATETEIILLFY